MTANPTLLSMPLAQNGQKNVIPETQATAGDGLFSQSTGFPAETSLPLGAGGVAPSREDFNGMANLLGGVAFYAQKGFTFNYDATQNYYVGCVVIDPIDGLRYECIADMAAGTIAPSADTAGDYWTRFGANLELANTDLSNLTATGENHFLEQDYTIIYPNGGTEANPANITINSRYVEANPFPGYNVYCKLEVLSPETNEWGEIPYGYYWQGASNVLGAHVSQLNDNAIVIVTAISELIQATSSVVQLSPLTVVTSYATLPCRVKVWKIGKQVSA